jgi:hypothetical protein
VKLEVQITAPNFLVKYFLILHFLLGDASVHAWHWMQEHGYNVSCASVSPVASQNLLGRSSFLWEMGAIQ